jgi:glycosyltransferase involved in cell wall biosynthesis
MKILMILTYYLPHRTGLTLHVNEVAKGLVKKGHDVTVLCANVPKSSSSEIINGVKVVRLPALLRISRGVLMPSYPLELYRLIKDSDVVNIHLPILESALISFCAKFSGKKVILTHHGDLHLPKGSFLNKLIEYLLFGFYKYSAKNAYKIIGYSHDYADHSYYLKPFRNKVKVIYPPIVVEVPFEEEIELLRKKNKLEDCKIIGFAGRFVEEKRPDYLINSLPFILKKIPTAKIVFAGEYKIKYENFYGACSSLIDKYANNLMFLGKMNSSKEMAAFYSMCDVLVLPSETECLGMVQVEAMLCGTPVVVNNIPGAREAVRVTRMGNIANASNPEELSETICEVISNKSKYVKSREVIRRFFNVDETIDGYEALFMEAVNNK